MRRRMTDPVPNTQRRNRASMRGAKNRAAIIDAIHTTSTWRTVNTINGMIPMRRMKSERCVDVSIWNMENASAIYPQRMSVEVLSHARFLRSISIAESVRRKRVTTYVISSAVVRSPRDVSVMRMRNPRVTTEKSQWPSERIFSRSERK